MIDITQEELIRLEDVRNYVPSCRKGKRLSKTVPFRWAAKGVRGVVLETLKIGGARYTSIDAIQRFAASLHSPQLAGPPSSNPSPPANALRSAGKGMTATAELDAMGF